MSLAILNWVYGKMIAYAPLVNALGSNKKILQVFPDMLNTLPVVSFEEIDNRDDKFYDNLVVSTDEVIQIHIFTPFDTPTTTIGDLVTDFFHSILFTKDTSQDMPDPNTKVRHRVAKYSRANMVAADLS